MTVEGTKGKVKLTLTHEYLRNHAQREARDLAPYLLSIPEQGTAKQMLDCTCPNIYRAKRVVKRGYLPTLFNTRCGVFTNVLQAEYYRSLVAEELQLCGVGSDALKVK